MKKVFIEHDSIMPKKRDRESLPQDRRQPGDTGFTLEELKAWVKMSKCERSLKVYNDLLDTIEGNR